MKRDWTLVRLVDGKWSVRFRGKELWILPVELHWTKAREVEMMLNKMDVVPRDQEK